MTDAIYTIQESTLTDIADAVRSKKGTSSPIAVTDLADEIESISGGGSSTYTKKGLASYTIKPIDAQYVTDAYKGTSYNDETLANCPSLADVYTLFYDKYLSANRLEPLTDYTVTKKSLGKDQSGTYDLWEYDFCPDKWDRMILLSSGMNGYEVGGIFGLAYFLEEIVERHTGDALLTYLYEHVRIKVIPFINPWGYAQSPKMYTQSRGVNLNRNFDINGIWDDYYGPPGTNNYKGTAPFSEAETKILRQWTSDNYGAEFWIDCHTGIITTDKELYTCSLTTNPYDSRLTSAHAKLEAWTKDFYNLESVTTNYLYDLDSLLSQKWFIGTYNLPMLTIEQCSKITSIGLLLNGEAKSFINYEAQIYGYVGEFLLKADETVVSNTYIEQLQQTAIDNKKYLAPLSQDTPVVGGDIVVKQGTILNTGEIQENSARLYTEDLIPFSNSTFHVEDLAGNGYWFGGRIYDASDNYIMAVSDDVSNSTVGYKNAGEHSTSWGTASDVTIQKGSSVSASATRIKFIIRTVDGTTNLTPSDVDGKEIFVDGIKYTLKAST